MNLVESELEKNKAFQEVPVMYGTFTLKKNIFTEIFNSQ